MVLSNNDRDMIKAIVDLLKNCSTDKRKFPATELYCEGWMLRIVLDWFASNPSVKNRLSIPSGSDWYSEARLPSTFLPRYRRDKFAEGHTHADGVIGQFSIKEGAESEFVLDKAADTFVVTEAKMFSKLSPKTSNSSYYNQAARNVACIAEILRRAELEPGKVSRLAFYVIAPESRIKQGIFSRHMDKEHIHGTVERRVQEYDEPKTEWFEEWFEPALEQMDVDCISWEELIEDIGKEMESSREEFQEFYNNCLKFNRLVETKYG